MFLQGIYEDFLLFMKNGLRMELFLLKIAELLYYLEHFSFDQSELRRTYYTPSQIEIAKRTHEIIVSDLRACSESLHARLACIFSAIFCQNSR